MAKLQAQGKIRIVGVSINDAASGQWLLDQGVAQVFQVAYNLLAPEVGEAIFATAEEKGVGIMIRVPMAQGILTGKFRPGQPVADDHRAHRAGQAMEQRINAAEALRQVADGAELPMSHFALRYALSPRAVSAVIPGARNTEQLTSNVAASNGSGLGKTHLGQVAAIQHQLQNA